MSVQSIIQKCISEVPKSLAAGVVDMGSGMLLGVKTVDSHPQEVLDLVAAATKDLYEGDNVTAIENMFKKMRGVHSDERYFQEIIVVSKNLVHFFSRLKSTPTVVICVVCKQDANLGLMLTKGRLIAQTETI